MKRLTYFLLVLFLIISPSLNSDVILVKPNSVPHTNEVCVRINNLNDFPDLALVGVWDCYALSNSDKAFRVMSYSCINATKTCPILLYAMSLDYFKTVDLDEIDFDDNKNVKKLNLTVKDNLRNTNLYSFIYVDYNLARYKDSTLYLYKTKMTYKFDDRRPDSIKNFNNDVVDPFKPISVEP